MGERESISGLPDSSYGSSPTGNTGLWQWIYSATQPGLDKPWPEIERYAVPVSAGAAGRHIMELLEDGRQYGIIMRTAKETGVYGNQWRRLVLAWLVRPEEVREGEVFAVPPRWDINPYKNEYGAIGPSEVVIGGGGGQWRRTLQFVGFRDYRLPLYIEPYNVLPLLARCTGVVIYDPADRNRIAPQSVAGDSGSASGGVQAGPGFTGAAGTGP